MKILHISKVGEDDVTYNLSTCNFFHKGPAHNIVIQYGNGAVTIQLSSSDAADAVYKAMNNFCSLDEKHSMYLSIPENGSVVVIMQ